MLAKITIADYMAKRLISLDEETDVLKAIQTLLDHKITSAPVFDKDKHLVGMFSEKDGMKVILDSAYNQGMSGKVSEYMSKDIVTVNADASIVDLAEKFNTSSVRAYPVYEDNTLVGVISRTDVLQALASIR